MTVTIDIPQEAADLLQKVFGSNLNRSAIEALALEGYRSGKLSRFEVQKIVGFDNRWDTEEWLAAHGATLNYSIADLHADHKTLNDIMGPSRS